MSSSSDLERARSAFRTFLEQGAGDGEPDFARLLAEVDPELREELGRIVGDYRGLRSLLREAPAPEDGAVIGDFRLVGEIGRGGMGVIWEAEQLSLHRRVALKLLHPHYSLSAGVVGRFRLEAEAGARVRHPGIVSVIAVGQHEGRWFLAQELVEGGRTLADRIADARERAEVGEHWYRETAELFAAIADALQAAHEAGVVHRDVKPSNVLLDGEGRPKVADFGLAKVTDELGFSRTGQLLGTPFYMSPEQAADRRDAIGPQSDVFSLGATLYEALTLRRPFEGDTSQQVLGQILHEDPPDPRRLRSRCPQELAAVCLRAMEKEPPRRYASAAALRDDLRRFLEHRPVVARPPGALRRARKWTRRHPTLAAVLSGTTLAVGVISGLLLSTMRAHREAEEQAQRAELRARQAQESAAMLESTARFVTDVFRGQLLTRTHGELGIGRQLLAGLVEDVRADGDLPDEERSQRLEILGRLFGTVAHYDTAIELLREGLAWRERALGTDDLRTARTRIFLAQILAEKERWRAAPDPAAPGWAEAEALARGARALFLREDQGQQEVYDAELVLACVAAGRGNFARTAAHARHVHEGRARLLGPTHEDTLDACLLLADACFRLERAEEAEAALLGAARACLAEPQRPELRHLFLRTLARALEPFPEPSPTLHGWDPRDTNRRVPFEAMGLGEEPDALRALLPLVAANLSGRPGTLSEIGNLANQRYRGGRMLEAGHLLSLVGYTMQEVYGTHHNDSYTCLGNLGNALCALGQHAKAAPLYERYAQLNRNHMGETHGLTLVANTVLASNEAHLGHGERAEELLRETLALAREGLGERSPVFLRAEIALASLLSETGRLTEAQTLLDHAAALLAATAGPGHGETLECDVDRGRLLLRMGQPEVAAFLLEETLATSRRTQGEETLVTASCAHRLAEALHQSGRPEDALPHAVAALRTMRTLLGTGAEETREAARLLETLQTELGLVPKPDLAAGCDAFDED